MKSVRFHDSKLKLVKALLFRSFHETEASTADFVQRLFVEGHIQTQMNIWLDKQVLLYTVAVM